MEPQIVETQIIGKIDFNEIRLSEDLKTILGFEFSHLFHYYVFGDWECCALWNKTGDKNYVFLEDYQSAIRPTELGVKVPYINEIIHSTFNMEYLKLARIFSVANNGLLVPHRDFIELDKQFIRLHIPLQTNEFAYNSEDEHIYNLQKGEIWYLNASQAHSAACFSKEKRLNLVLDFAPDVPIPTLFKNKSCYQLGLKPKEAERIPLTEDFIQRLYLLAPIIDKHNFNDIVSLLAKIHYFKKTNVGSMFEWLAEIVRLNGDSELIQRAKLLEEACFKKRNAHTLSD